MDKAIAAREILLLGAFQEARAAALAEGIEIIPLKGAALLELGIYQPGERGMADADLLLRPKDLPGFEALLGRLGYQPMPNSADAWLKPSPNSAPPAILDLHTGLWHIKSTGELFEWGLEPGPGGLCLNLADLFLHAAAHPLLHHGELSPRNLEDCVRIALRAPGGGEKFWAAVSRKTNIYGLRPVIWPVIRRLAPGPLSIPEAALLDLAPRGAEKIKAAFFEKAAEKHSSALEYLLPALHRPGLLLKYAVPEKRFMLRRYGAAGLALYLLRPLKLLWSILRR
ncbi:MAG: hypothetical protein A2X35_08425 [Elusimicrobia bacterium GWA2_61_42]|nr:MAG: hypothetical protein A2X35_08425 [Elusimicrobia bacterium GWA2_61_42]OGR77263.1 MAG: hypothetical protein A2X38_08975 [Elusimicrobia bacterium GWC2_61_25]